MLKFFRRIRRKLLRKGNLKRYLVYALGEILLVMIGILLALQVNNLNEQRKKSNQEITILKQLNGDLKANLIEIEEIYRRVIVNAQAKDSIIYFLENAELFEQELKLYLHQIQFHGGNFNNANAAYKYIESEGINALSNEEIRKDITMMYDNYFENIEIRQSSVKQHFFSNLFPLIKELFVPRPLSKLSTLPLERNTEVLNYPRDPQALKNNQEFINVLTKLQELYLFRKYTLEITMNELRELIEKIETEIDRLE